jgi:hypothetical protein
LGASDAGCRVGKHILTQHANNEDGVAGADLVAVCEGGLFYASAIKESAVAAVEIEKAATFFSVLDGEVQAGHELVVGEGVIRLSGAADSNRLSGCQLHLLSCEGTGTTFQDEFHRLGGVHAWAGMPGRRLMADIEMDVQ